MVLIHTAIWILLLSLPILLQQSLQHNRPAHRELDRDTFIYAYLFNNILWIVFFYINAYVLISRYIYQKKFSGFVLAHLLIIALLMASHWIFYNFFFTESRFAIQSFFLFNFFPYLFILASSTAYRMIQDRIDADRLQQARETENLKTELSFLRSQVSPHFMFNVLNNMVALARKKSDLLEPSLIKLSSLMRYMLYETDEEKVALDKEVEYLHSYIDLQQQRFGKKLVVNVSVQPADNGYEIEPMLLIPFVENAFKHGTGMITDPKIDIELSAKNNLLQFTVRNKYNADSLEVQDKTSGIGLTNVKRRLNLLYGRQHTLLVTKKDGWFLTSLQINLH